MRNIFVALTVVTFALPCWAKIKVVTTTTDVGSIVRAVGGDHVEVDVIAKGTQDPHFIETKPSYMVKLSKADSVFANGLALESGWLPQLIQGSRNPKLRLAYLELGEKIKPLEVPSGQISRAMGDVHPEGNPHFTLDPVRVAELAPIVANRLKEVDPANAENYAKGAASFANELQAKMPAWQARIEKLPQKKVVTYHNSLLYFCTRFGLTVATVLEPKPGIPPSASHILSVIDTMKREKIKAILVDNFFDPKIAERVAKDVPGAKVQVVGIAVESKPELKTLSDVTEQLVTALEVANK